MKRKGFKKEQQIIYKEICEIADETKFLRQTKKVSKSEFHPTGG